MLFRSADIIIGMAPMFFEKLVSGGTLITSGIISPRADEVASALEQVGFLLVEKQISNDWVAFTASKPV